MPTYPNSGLVNTLAPFYGSCKIEISTDSGTSWTNIGLARGVSFNETMDIANILADNGPDIEEYVAQHKVEIKFNALEFFLSTFNKLRGGIDVMSTVAASATTRTDTIATGDYTFRRPIWLGARHATSTMPSITFVKNVNGATTTTLTTADDYNIIQDDDNQRGIVLRTAGDGGDGKTSEALYIKYVYGAVSSYKLTSGGLSNITSRWFRLTNKQMVGGVAKYRRIVLYSGSLNAGLNLAFKSANEADPVLETPISIICKLDTTRTEGDQLFYIEDEVGLT